MYNTVGKERSGLYVNTTLTSRFQKSQSYERKEIQMSALLILGHFNSQERIHPVCIDSSPPLIFKMWPWFKLHKIWGWSCSPLPIWAVLQRPPLPGRHSSRAQVSVTIKALKRQVRHPWLLLWPKSGATWHCTDHQPTSCTSIPSQYCQRQYNILTNWNLCFLWERDWMWDTWWLTTLKPPKIWKPPISLITLLPPSVMEVTSLI